MENDGFKIKPSVVNRVLSDEEEFAADNGGNCDNRVITALRSLLNDSRRMGGIMDTVITRVCGELAVSRSIGDGAFKRPRDQQEQLYAGPDYLPYPLSHPMTFGPDDLVSGDCDITVFENIQEEEEGEGDRFLVIGCDGIWDVRRPSERSEAW